MSMVTIDSFLTLDHKEKDHRGLVFFTPSSSYQKVLSAQKKAVEILKANPQSAMLYALAGEHPPTFSGGRSLSQEKLKQIKSNFDGEVFSTERGGRLMYHGPGQLTIYFIFNLKKHFKGPKEYVETFFTSVQKHFLNSYEIDLDCRNQGLWYKQKKVGFMGLRVSQGVVYHGMSLNYSIDLVPFLKHSPCNIEGSEVGNIFSSQLSCLFFKDEACSILKNMPFKES